MACGAEKGEAPPPLQRDHATPSATYILPRFQDLTNQGDLDVMSSVYQELAATGNVDNFIEVLSDILDDDRVNEISAILNRLIDQGAIFELSPITTNLLRIFSADKEPGVPGVQSSFDVLIHIFETGVIDDLIVPMRNVLANESAVQVVPIQNELFWRLGPDNFQDVLDVLNILFSPYSKVLPPSMAYLEQGNNASIYKLSANRLLTISIPAPDEAALLFSEESCFFLTENSDCSVERGAVSARAFFVETDDGDDPCRSGDFSGYKVSFTSGLNAGGTFRILEVVGSAEDPTLFDPHRLLLCRAAENRDNLCPSITDRENVCRGLAELSQACPGVKRIEDICLQEDSGGVFHILDEEGIPFSAVLFADHGKYDVLGKSSRDFVTNRILAGDMVVVISGEDAGLTFPIMKDAVDTLSPGKDHFGDILHLGSPKGGLEIRNDQSNDSDYLIRDKEDPTLAFALTELKVVRDVLPIIEATLNERADPDDPTSANLVELALRDMVRGDRYTGDNYISALEMILLANVRTDTNADALYDLVDNLDRNGDGGPRDSLNGKYVYFDPVSFNNPVDFLDVNNNGSYVSGENFDVDGDGIFDERDFSADALLDPENYAAVFFDPDRNGAVDCDLFTDPINCPVFDTNNDGVLDSDDLLPTQINELGEVTLAEGFSVKDTYPPGMPDGVIDYRDLLNTRILMPQDLLFNYKNRVNTLSGNPFGFDDNLPRTTSALLDESQTFFASDAGPVLENGLKSLIAIFENPDNLTIQGKPLPTVLLANLGQVTSARDDITGEPIIGPAIVASYAMISDGPTVLNDVRGSYPPGYDFERDDLGQVKSFLRRKTHQGSTSYEVFGHVDKLFDPIHIMKSNGEYEYFMEGVPEFYLKNALGKVQNDPKASIAHTAITEIATLDGARNVEVSTRTEDPEIPCSDDDRIECALEALQPRDDFPGFDAHAVTFRNTRIKGVVPGDYLAVSNRFFKKTRTNNGLFEDLYVDPRVTYADFTDNTAEVNRDTEEICNHPDVFCARVLQVVTESEVINPKLRHSDTLIIDGPLPTGAYYATTINFLDRLPRQVYEVLSFTQIDGRVPTIDRLPPNLDFSNVINNESDIAIFKKNFPDERVPTKTGRANSGAFASLSINQQMGAMFPIMNQMVNLHITEGTVTEMVRPTVDCRPPERHFHAPGAKFLTNDFRTVKPGKDKDILILLHGETSSEPGETSSELRFEIKGVPKDEDLCVVGPEVGPVKNDRFRVIRPINAIAGLIDLMGAMSITTTENFVLDSEPIMDAVLGNGAVSEEDARTLVTGFDALTSTTRLGFLPVMFRILQPFTRGNDRDQEIDTAVIDLLTLMHKKIQLAHGETTDNQSVMRHLEPTLAQILDPEDPFVGRLLDLLFTVLELRVNDAVNLVVVNPTVFFGSSKTYTTVTVKGLPISPNDSVEVTISGNDLAEDVVYSTKKGDRILSIGQDGLGQLRFSAPLGQNRFLKIAIKDKLDLLRFDISEKISVTPEVVIENRNDAPTLFLEFVDTLITPEPLKNSRGFTPLDSDGRQIEMRPLDKVMAIFDDFMALAVDCTEKGERIFNCTRPRNLSEFTAQLTPFGETVRDFTIINGNVVQDDEFISNLLPYATSIMRLMEKFFEETRGQRKQNTLLSVFRVFLANHHVEASATGIDAFQSLDPTSRDILTDFVVDQFDVKTGFFANLINIIDPILSEDKDGKLAGSISELLRVNPTLPEVVCSGGRSLAAQSTECIVDIIASVPEQDVGFLYDTFIELVDSGQAEVLVSLFGELLTSGNLERIAPALILMNERGAMDELILFMAASMNNDIIGIEK